MLIDPKDMPPQEIAEAAQLIYEWFAKRNIFDWEFMNVKARFPNVGD